MKAADAKVQRAFQSPIREITPPLSMIPGLDWPIEKGILSAHLPIFGLARVEAPIQGESGSLPSLRWPHRQRPVGARPGTETPWRSSSEY